MNTPDLMDAQWRTSSYSGTNTNCVEVAPWRTSSYSGSNAQCVEVAPWRTSSHSGTNANCVEAAPAATGTAIRDSKRRDGGVLLVSRTQWSRFIRHLSQA